MFNVVDTFGKLACLVCISMEINISYGLRLLL